MTLHRNDVGILQLQLFRGIKVHRIVMFLNYYAMQLTMIKLYHAMT